MDTAKNPGETLIVGLYGGPSNIPFVVELPLYWDPALGNQGYHSIRWQRTAADHFEIRDKLFITDDRRHWEVGVHLDEIVCRDEKNWYWPKTPIPLFSGATGFNMERPMARALEQLSAEAFAGLHVQDEFHGRDVLVGFGTLDEVALKRIAWYDTMQAAFDPQLGAYLAGEKNGEAVKIFERWLFFLPGTEDQEEHSKLRYLLVRYPALPENVLAAICSGMKSSYEAYDREAGTHQVHRTSDWRDIIVPENKLFAHPATVIKAAQELREKLISEKP